jgi:RecA-family ATPase
VFALRPGSKLPLNPGWKDRTLDAALAEISANPGCNLGWAPGDDHIVIDVDVKNGVNGFLSLKDAGIELPPTLSATTPSGGKHLIFRKPPGLKMGNAVGVLPGVDVRARGGYIAVAPSTVGGRPYVCDWSTPIADASAQLPALAQQRPAPSAPATHEADDQIPAGARNATLAQIAGSLRRAGLSVDEITDALQRVNARRCQPPLDESEVETIAASVGRYAVPPQAWQVGFGQSPLPPGALAAPLSRGLSAPAITAAELTNAQRSPACIVERLLYADVACLVAPGGIGKTTLMLHASACIALGRPVFGERVFKRGRVLILTAEDSRGILVARLRACMDADNLTDGQRHTVMDGVRIADVSGEGFKLTEVISDVVRPAPNINTLIEMARELQPVLIVIDPAVSFGVGESRTNDAEQGLIEAARKLRNAMNCCVLYVHHTGKANARDKTLDQYSGRGGSAFADGSRMVMVLQPLDAVEFETATGQPLGDGETGLTLARPKISYCPPPGTIYIKRTGYRFERVAPGALGRLKVEANADQLWQLLAVELAAGRRHSKNTIESIALGTLKRGEIRAALSWLEASGRIEYRDDPGLRKRGPRKYIHPIAITSPNIVGEVSEDLPKKEAISSPDETRENLAAALREIKPGEVFIPPCPLTSPNIVGEVSARLARFPDDPH